MKLNKCFFFHDWTKWQTIVNRPFGITYWRLTQTRKCLRCNTTQIKDKIR